MEIKTVSDFDKALENGPYAWPGGYPLYFLMSDGEALDFEAAESEAELIRNAIRENDNSEWRVIACCINWDDEELYCAHSCRKIASAYGEK